MPPSTWAYTGELSITSTGGCKRKLHFSYPHSKCSHRNAADRPQSPSETGTGAPHRTFPPGRSQGAQAAGRRRCHLPRGSWRGLQSDPRARFRAGSRRPIGQAGHLDRALVLRSGIPPRRVLRRAALVAQITVPAASQAGHLDRALVLRSGIPPRRVLRRAALVAQITVPAASQAGHLDRALVLRSGIPPRRVLRRAALAAQTTRSGRTPRPSVGPQVAFRPVGFSGVPHSLPR